MTNLLPFIVVGIATGAVYGLAGTGLVLAYKTSGIFNFAYGSLSALTVFVFYFLHNEHGWSWPLAALFCLFVLAPIEGLLLELFGRSLEDVSPTLKVVATVGLLLIVVGVGTLWYGNLITTFPQFLPQSTVYLAGVNITWSQIIVIITSVVATAILYYFFRFVRMGVAMRGVVDNPDLVSMAGESPARVRRWAWVISSIFASLAGLLLAPSLTLNALIITMLVVQAFGAAAIGYFSSLPLTFLGGLIIGVAGAVAAKYTAYVPSLSGLSAGLPFIILFVVLLVTPRAKLTERRVVHTLPVKKPWEAPARVRLVTYAAVIVLAGFLPQLVGDKLSVWSSALIDVILFLSLGLLVRSAGQISLCQFAFAAIGAAAFGHLTSDYHVPWLLAVLLACLIAVPVGAIVAIPAIRLSGVFLALATFGFGILLEQVFYVTNFMFGPTATGIPAPRPDVSIGAWNMSTDNGFYYLLLIFTVLSVALIIAIQRGRMGRLLGGLSDSPTALELGGATPNVIRVLIFCISAALAAFSGVLLACLVNYSVASNYTSFSSLLLVTLIIISVGGAPWYAIVAAVGLTVFSGYVTAPNVNTYLGISFGFFAATYAVFESRSAGVPLWLRNFLDKIGGRQPEVVLTKQDVELAVGSADSDEVAAARADLEQMRAPRVTLPGSGLKVDQVSVHFGGVKAVNNVTLAAPLGRITGLVGPNGAGKTTIFNACSGLLQPTGGRVFFNDADVSQMSASARSRLGLGRTFQRAELYNLLTVRENVTLGREASMAGRNPLTQLFCRRGEQKVVKAAVDEAIEVTGIGALADLQAGLLPTGQRRLVELARALAGPFSLLLLDEPSAGLDANETQRFGAILTAAVHGRGIGLLLVEHDMALVRQVCQYVYVLDFGRLIFEGTTEMMHTSDVVRAAYLGSDSVSAGVGTRSAEVGDGLTLAEQTSGARSMEDEAAD
jgi:ABC-type branched-subunit amino acid transport system ATPase component/branched-subunit amino acid ABC-type transport system permease component